MEKAFEEIGVRVDVKCENRSLKESEVELTLNKESSQGVADCKKNSLCLLFDSIISPIANTLEGDELVIVPDGLLCLVPYAACVDEAYRYLSESTRIRILPSLTALKLITDSPEDYHSKNGGSARGRSMCGGSKEKAGQACQTKVFVMGQGRSTDHRRDCKH